MTRSAFLAAVGVYVLAAALGWAVVGILVGLWWGS
jgi:hypothetical protein